MTPKTSWTFDDLIDDVQATKDAIAAFVAKYQVDTTYYTDSKKLRLALDDYEHLIRQHSPYTLSVFIAHLQSDLDTQNSELKSTYNKLEEQTLAWLNDLQFFELTIAKNPILIDENLSPYKHFLEKLYANGKHKLSDGEERVMTLMSVPGYGRWSAMISQFMATSSDQGRPLQKLINMCESVNGQERLEAKNAINKILAQHVATAEHELNAILQTHKVSLDLRKFSRPESPRLLEDDIEPEIVDAMIGAVTADFGTSHTWYAMKAKALGKQKLGYWERNVALAKAEIKMDFDQVFEICNLVFENLGYGDIYRELFAKGRIDYYQKVGKRSGGYCSSLGLHTPSYILINATGDIEDARTLAHEMGHAINIERMRTACHALDFDTPLSTAEVASTFMEDFLFLKLLETATPDKKKTLLAGKIDDLTNTIYRQVACYNFERELHATYAKALWVSQAQIGELFVKHMRAYLGDSVLIEPEYANWWVYWSHIRRPFYVYSYASGLLISLYLQSRVRQDKSFMTSVDKFLSSGGSASPKEIFASIGLDLTNPKIWSDGLKVIRGLIEEYQAI